MRLTDSLVALRQFNSNLCDKNQAPQSQLCRDVLELKVGVKIDIKPLKMCCSKSSREERVDEKFDYYLKQGRVDICHSFRFKYSWK